MKLPVAGKAGVEVVVCQWIQMAIEEGVVTEVGVREALVVEALGAEEPVGEAKELVGRKNTRVLCNL